MHQEISPGPPRRHPWRAVRRWVERVVRGSKRRHRAFTRGEPFSRIVAHRTLSEPACLTGAISAAATKDDWAMYVPPAFQESDRSKLFDFVEAHSFGLLVSQLDGQLFATHLPLLVDRHSAAQGRLVGHVARANPQWRELADQQVLVVFSGPHAYVSPRWYEAENVVPTWNYVAVHAYGRCQLIDDPAALGDIL